MEPKLRQRIVRADNVLGSETGFWHLRITSTEPSPRLIRQDFFKTVVFSGGEVLHVVNGFRQILRGHVLLIIRPSDVHYYDGVCGEHEYLTVGFSRATFDALAEFLGAGFEPASVLKPLESPMLALSRAQKLAMERRFSQIERIAPRNKLRAKALYQTLLVEQFSYFLAEPAEPGRAMPQWLVRTCREMKDVANFSKGVGGLPRIAQRTYSQIWRMFRRHLGQTPSEYVNELRVTYAADLLVHTQKKVISIVEECGFGSSSQFYDLFAKRFGMSPGRFRANAGRTPRA